MARWRRPRSGGRVTPAKVKRSKTFKRGMIMSIALTALALAVFPKAYQFIYEKTPTFNGGS